MRTTWFDISTYGNPKHTGRFLVRARNGWIGELTYDRQSDYWHTMGYQSDIKEWSYLETTIN